MKWFCVPYEIKQNHRPEQTVELCVTQEVSNVVAYTTQEVLKEIRQEEIR